MYTFLIIAALVFEAILAAVIVYNCVRRRQIISQKTLWYAIPVFILIYFLYATGYTYAGNEWTAVAAINMLSATLRAFVFDISTSYVEALTGANPAYLVAVCIAFVFAGATTISSVIAFFGRRLVNGARLAAAIKNGREFVLGTSENSISYAERNGAIIVAPVTDAQLHELMRRSIPVLRRDLGAEHGASPAAYLRHRLVKGAMYHFIAFKDNNFVCSELISQFNAQFSALCDTGFTLHVQAALTEMDIINRKFIDSEKKDNICIKSFSKYELASRKFIIEHPISRYLPENFYLENRAIRPEKNINAVFIGLGKVNYELMKLMIMQNQFVGTDGKKLINHPVNYYGYDCDEGRIYADTFLSTDFDCSEMHSPDLPPPEKVCNVVEMKKQNVHSAQFVSGLKSVLCDENSFSFVIVSLGDDYQNVAYAERLNSIIRCKNVKFFARVRDNDFNRAGSRSEVTMFGNEREILSRSVIINDALDGVCRRLNNIYNSNTKAEIKAFNRRPTVEIFSNIYHATSIFFKINLLGLDFVKAQNADGAQAITRQEFMNMFKGFDAHSGYEKYFGLSAWNVLGFSEHSRWIAYYVLKGFRPMPLSGTRFEEVTKNGKTRIEATTKNIPARLHCCMTDYYGLDKYHKFLLASYRKLQSGKNTTIDDVETYKYDYMFILDAFDEMQQNGYVLIKNTLHD